MSEISTLLDTICVLDGCDDKMLAQNSIKNWLTEAGDLEKWRVRVAESNPERIVETVSCVENEISDIMIHIQHEEELEEEEADKRAQDKQDKYTIDSLSKTTSWLKDVFKETETNRTTSEVY